MSNRPKIYHRIHRTISILETLIGIALMALVSLTPVGRELEGWISVRIANPYAAFLGFVLVLGVLNLLLTAPLSFYGGFVIEHRFGLSNQTFGGWLRESLKGLGVGALIGAPLLLAFYYGLRTFGAWWWLPVAAVFFFFSVLLARIAPTVLFPLFYTFKPLNNERLTQKLVGMAEQAGLSIAGVFEFDLSKTTKKANAAFAGIGRAKRILLADTLLNDFTEDEIATVFAHEAGHYAHRHIAKGIGVGVVNIFGGLWIASLVYETLYPVLGFQQRSELAALLLLALIFTGLNLITAPLFHALSRRFERQADAYALRTTQNKDAFIGAMRRLSVTNLADEDPHPVIEFLFYSHPSIGKRIRAAESAVL